MNAVEIFKMEIFKNLRDRSYLLLALIIGGIASFLSILLMVLVRVARIIDTETSYLSPVFVLLISGLMIALVGYIVYGFLYPLHLLSLDYRNGVLNLMVASGVKRTSLYFAKMGATILSTIIVMFWMCAVPLIALLIGGLEEVFALLGILELTPETILGVLFALFWLAMGYLASLVILCFSVILVKGSYASIIIMCITQQLCSLLFLPFSRFFEGSSVAVVAQLLLYLAEILVFGFQGIRVLKKQNL